MRRHPMRHHSPALVSAAFLLLLLASPTTAQVGPNLRLVNPNLASSEELAALPQMDESLAAAVVAARPFLDMTSLDALLREHGRADEAREELYGHLWVPINVNTASREEILLIPGVGERMLHEFEEYRPYVALAQFQREIGKYVDEGELARLAQYVFVPIDLNTATEEDILSIPGVGERMLHEFLEYRPYQAMAQFEREMGKYVDDDEVARMARYVEVRPSN
jgi:DNA uptake protein ComE-like DNA-binding protein